MTGFSRTSATALLVSLLLSGCHAPKPPPAPKPEPVVTVSAVKVNTVEAETDTVTPLSPYSTEGLKSLNEIRNAHHAVDAFLIRNRKPDYFFSSNTNGVDKAYLIYAQSDNLYVFSLADDASAVPYKKFHPVPDSLRQTLERMYHEHELPADAPVPVAAPAEAVEPHAAFATDETVTPQQIEKSLSERNPVSGLNRELLASIPTPASGVDGDNRLYIKTYYLDKSLDELLENEYAAKYDAKKEQLKFSFPQSWETKRVYRQANFEALKIYVERNVKAGSEVSLVVPDFLPGSPFYTSAHNATVKLLGSLYQVNVSQDYVSSDRLRMRFAVKLCQRDNASFCAAKNGDVTSIRAIVVAATLYDSATKTVVDTFVLK